MKKRLSIILVSMLVAIVIVYAVCISYAGEESKKTVGNDNATVVESEKTVGNKDQEISKVETSKTEENETTSGVKKSTPIVQQISLNQKKESSQTPISSSTPKPTGSSNSNASKPVTTTSTSPSKPVHTHEWIAVYASRIVPVYESRRVVICDDCGAIVSDAGGMSAEERSAHMNMHIDNGDKYGGGTHSETRKVQTGTTTEKYISSYKCSCGATK